MEKALAPTPSGRQPHFNKVKRTRDVAWTRVLAQLHDLLRSRFRSSQPTQPLGKRQTGPPTPPPSKTTPGRCAGRPKMGSALGSMHRLVLKESAPQNSKSAHRCLGAGDGNPIPTPVCHHHLPEPPPPPFGGGPGPVTFRSSTAKLPRGGTYNACVLGSLCGSVSRSGSGSASAQILHLISGRRFP